MSRIDDTPKYIYASDEKGHPTDQVICHIHDASRASVDLVLSQDVDAEDGRSQWLWVRLQNGDLILGCFPMADTYMAVEDDASFSYPEPAPRVPPGSQRLLTARFTPEAWVRDNAVEVDPEGDVEWDVTEMFYSLPADFRIVSEVAAMGDHDDVLDNDDVLKDDPNAPAWIRNWHGPFSIHVRWPT